MRDGLSMLLRFSLRGNYFSNKTKSFFCQEFFQIHFHIFTSADGDRRSKETAECYLILITLVIVAEYLDHAQRLRL